MLKRNNPNIDFDALEAEIDRNLDLIEAAKHADTATAEEYDAVVAPSAATANNLSSLEDLYALHGEAFVHGAYQEFLGRAPDPEGLSSYLAQLALGTSKADILAALRYSTDGAQRKQRFDLPRVRLKAQLSRLPIVGKLFDIFFALLGLAALKRSMLAGHHHVREIEQELWKLRSDNATLHERADQQTQDLNDAEHELNVQRVNSVAEINVAIAALEGRVQREVAALQAMQLRLQPSPADTLTPEPGIDPDYDFYRRFENHFRGPASEIAERLSVYPPLLAERVPEALRQMPAVDLGCGRGEWLAMLQHHGYKAHGVDLDPANVDHCSEQSLSAEHTEALAYLRSCESESVAVISAFHVIEHLTFTDLNMLLVDAIRVLAPGGLLLLETPNPENLVTAAHQFYLDPSHQQPLPPELMDFLLDYRGFRQVEIHRLHPVPEHEQVRGDDEAAARLNELVSGPRDYAVVAAKPA